MDAPQRIWITYEGDRCKPFPERPEYLRGTWTSVDFQNGRRPSYVHNDIHEALQAEVERLRADLREAAMQALADAGQAQMAYEAQLKAEAEAKRLRDGLGSIARNTCCDGCQEAARWASAVLRDDAAASGGKSGGSDAT